MKRGDIVYDIADRRHVAIIRCINHGQHATANLEWLDSGWKSFRVPVSDLRVVHHFEHGSRP
jgi:hypothetical protein